MKFTTASLLLATASTATAFMPHQTPPSTARKTQASVLESSPSDDNHEENIQELQEMQIKRTIETGEPVEEVPTIPTGETSKSSSKRMSRAIPFLQSPPALDGSMTGDVGFDPFGFAKSPDDLLKYREAEIKHGRLAMLAAAGWPLSEVFDKKIASGLGLPAVLDGTDRAPSVLNGGLGKVSPIYWALCLAGAAAVELYGIRVVSNRPGYEPGDLGFDPLGLMPTDGRQADFMRLAELKNGRLAMIAITAFAAQVSAKILDK